LGADKALDKTLFDVQWYAAINAFLQR